jgi:2-methylaconitate cis-trans-isomerase PrpF
VEDDAMRVRCTIMRGGTSKAVFIPRDALPADPGEWDGVVLRILGSPDRRQIDGLGGADLLTSKVAVIGPPTHPDADLDYVFGQVSVTEPEIDWSTNCGNVSVAVGPYAITEGYVNATDPVTRVRIHSPRQGRILIAEVPTADGQVVEAGDFAIFGVPGTGARITMDYTLTAGSKTAGLLPTGRARDVLEVPGVGRLEGSFVDAGNPAFFCRGEALGLDGREGPTDIDGDAALVDRIERARRAGARVLGLVAEWVRLQSPILPLLIHVYPAQDQPDFVSGGTTPAGEMDFLAKLYCAGFSHKVFAGTSTICTGAASKVPGSVVHALLSAEATAAPVVRIGHFAGVIPVEAVVAGEGRAARLVSAKMWRTARRILDGHVYVPDSVLAGRARAAAAAAVAGR